jgi:ribosomal protein S18 acetylase RimI-like enzyme
MMREPFLNSLAIYDLKFQRHRSDFYICRDEDGNILAYLENFRYSLGTDSILRGKSQEAISKLLDLLPKKENGKRAEVHVDPSHLLLLEGVARIDEGAEPEMLMVVKRGEEKRPDFRNPVVKLPPSYAQELVRLHRRETDITGELIRENEERLAKGMVYGILENGRLVSSATADAKLPFVWVISGVRTLPEYKRRGYASMLVFSVTVEALQNAGAAALYVRENNHDAMRIYERMGYRPIARSIQVKLG